VDLFAAGSVTVSLVLNWTVLYLTTHQDVQEKLHEEIDRVIGKTRNPKLLDRPKLAK